MWDIAKYPSLRVKTWRRAVSFVAAALAVASFLTLTIVPKTYAIDASWNDSASITYDGNIYTGPSGEATNLQLGLDKSVKSFTFVDPDVAANGTAQPQPTNVLRKIHIIYFDASADLSVTSTAYYKTFTYQSATNFTDPSSVTQITIDKQSLAKATSQPNASSCTVEGGLGWIVCPVSNYLAKGMDYVFKILSGFLEVRPVSNNTDDALFRAWSDIRNIANVAFVIGFLIVIYSQLTNLGINNYGIKKLLPKIIISALLVNVSYYICAVAVDISNVLGGSLQELFISIRNGLVGTTGNNWDVTSWDSISGFVLSGGTVAIAGTTAAVIALSTYGVAGALFLLLPALLSGLVAVLVALTIMAARQALITILIIASPLAFVAYLLPNTDKWYKKWQSTLMQMLILFPAFSVIYGGSQLAASVIIQNADSINTLILGMFVQVAPLFITPLLIKLSGSTLAKIGDLVRKTAKPMLDKNREWTKDRGQNIAARRLGATARPKNLLVRNAQRRDINRRAREGRRNAYTAVAEGRYANTKRFADIDQIAREAADRKSLGESESESRYGRSKHDVRSRQHQLDTSLRKAKSDIDDAKKISDTQFELYQHKDFQNSDEFKRQSKGMQKLIIEAADHAQSISVQGMKSHAIKRAQETEFAQTLEAEENSELRNIAGAVVIDKRGADRVKATARAVVDKQKEEDIKAAAVLHDSQMIPGDKKDVAKELFLKAARDGDEIEARAAIKLLLQAGRPGKDNIESAIIELESDPSFDSISETMKGVKNDLLVADIIKSNIGLDNWALKKDNKPESRMENIIGTAKVYKALKYFELSAQTDLAMQHAYESGAISSDMAADILGNDQVSKDLSAGKKQFFEIIAAGRKPLYKLRKPDGPDAGKPTRDAMPYQEKLDINSLPAEDGSYKPVEFNNY